MNALQKARKEWRVMRGSGVMSRENVFDSGFEAGQKAGITKEQAQILVENYNINIDLRKEEETKLLKQHNPELLDACKAITKMSQEVNDDT